MLGESEAIRRKLCLTGVVYTSTLTGNATGADIVFCFFKWPQPHAYGQKDKKNIVQGFNSSY